MAHIVDARESSNDDVISRRRFLKRVRTRAKAAIDKKIADGNITDISEGGVDVHVPEKELTEPTFHHGQGGINRGVRPGNKEFHAGQEIQRPKGGGGGGSGKGDASNSGEGEDDFVYHLSQKEFLDLMFEGLGLPNMRRLNTQTTNETKRKYAGISSSGQMHNLHLMRSKRQKIGRRLAAENPYNRQIMEHLREAYNILSSYAPPEPVVAPAAATDRKARSKSDPWLPMRKQCQVMQGKVSKLRLAFWDVATPQHQKRLLELDAAIEPLEKKKSKIPKWDPDYDLRYRTFPEFPVPENKAVMFCVMDVSGSMDEEKKTFAKKFYFLLYMFLKKNYGKNVDVVFVRHHTTAKEVDEQEFFYGKESGGTVVSTALELMDNIVTQRYAGKNYDIYMAQASDGDNWESDNPNCAEWMKKILGYSRGAFYTEITRDQPQNLWRTYEALSKEHADNFWVGRIEEESDIWPIFRKFFSKHYSFDTGDRQRPAAALA